MFSRSIRAARFWALALALAGCSRSSGEGGATSSAPSAARPAASTAARVDLGVTLDELRARWNAAASKRAGAPLLGETTPVPAGASVERFEIPIAGLPVSVELAGERDRASGRLVRATLHVPSHDIDAQRAMSAAAALLDEAIAPELDGQSRLLVEQSLVSSASGSYAKNGLLFTMAMRKDGAADLSVAPEPR